MVLLLALSLSLSAQESSFPATLKAEQALQRHDQALAKLATGLEDWLSGRSDLKTIQTTVAASKLELNNTLSLSRETSSQVLAAQQGIVQAVSGFTANTTPSAEGQRALFARLNDYTRARSMALLQWRSNNNRRLLEANRQHRARADYLAWEAAWIPLWKSEIDITYRLQKQALSSGTAAPGNSFVREILALQSQASAVALPQQHTALQELSVRRLTVLARTAEQLDRLGQGESRGAVTRIRRLTKEQSSLDVALQKERLSVLSKLSK